MAIEAAAIASSAALCVIGVDTFHDLGRRIDPDWAREQAETWRRDFQGALDQMLRALLHPDIAPSFAADIRRRMRATPPDTVWHMFSSFAGYDLEASARRLRVPVRCINGDLFPTNIDANRRILRDFDAVVLPHAGHFPMLECPEHSTGRWRRWRRA